MSEWWIGYPAAEATVECAGATHRLRWEQGALRALDHEDAEGERTLAALGGQRYRCVDLLGAWARHEDDLRVLTLGSRGPSDPLAPPSGVGGGSGGWTGYAPMAWQPQPEPEDEVVSLLALGGGLPERLAATVAAAWTDRLEHGEAAGRAQAQLQAALYGRVTATLRAWLAQPELDVDVEVARDRERASLTADGAKVLARLPFAWLVDVWARGIATFWGRFCLAAGTADGTRWTLATVGPDLGSPDRVTVEFARAQP